MPPSNSNEPTGQAMPPAPDVQKTTQTSLKNRNPLILALGAIVAILIVVVLYLLFLGGSKSPNMGPALTVGTSPYVYACSVFDTDTLTKELSFNTDKNTQSAAETYSFDPFDTKTKQLDMLKESGLESISSTCKIRTNIAYATTEDGTRKASYLISSATIKQFASEKNAKAAFTALKSTATGAKTLPSFKDTSFYVASTDPAAEYATEITVHKNMTIGYSIPLTAGASNDAIAEKMDAVHKDVIRRIDAGEGTHPKNYTDITSIGDHPFVDICQNTSFDTIGNALGSGADFDARLFTSEQQYAPSDSQDVSPISVFSACNAYFRTADDITAQAALSKEATSAEDFKKYPHQLLVQVVTTKNSQDAQKLVENFKKSGEGSAAGSAKLSDVNIGDKAVKVFLAADSASAYDGYLQYIAKDNRVYVISILMQRQSEPYKTTTSEITDSQIATIYEALLAGVKRASK